MYVNYYACKQNLDGDKNKLRITGASVTNFQLTLASAEENFPVLRDLLGPVEPEISIFLRNQHGAERSFAQNVATNSHSVKYATL